LLERFNPAGFAGILKIYGCDRRPARAEVKLVARYRRSRDDGPLGPDGRGRNHRPKPVKKTVLIDQCRGVIERHRPRALSPQDRPFPDARAIAEKRRITCHSGQELLDGVADQNPGPLLSGTISRFDRNIEAIVREQSCAAPRGDSFASNLNGLYGHSGVSLPVFGRR
jgi:hypothetical protein